MNIFVDPDSSDMVRSQFSLMERVHNDAVVDSFLADDIGCESCRIAEKKSAADRIALVELCSTLMAMHMTTVAEIRVPRPGARQIKVG